MPKPYEKFPPRNLVTDDTKKLRLETRQVPRVPPAVGIFDFPLRCYVVNEEWAAHVMGAVSTLAEYAAWVGADDETAYAIQEIEKFMQGGGCDVIDCDLVENCLGSSITINAINITLYSFSFNVTQNHFDDLTAIYDGSPQSVGPNISVNPADDDARDQNALCASIHNAIGAYAAAKSAQISLKTGATVLWQEYINWVHQTFPIVPDWLMYLLGDELYGCVADFGQALTVLADQDAKDDLACCLFDELRDVVMSEANFNAAVASCAGSLSDNAGKLACLFDGDNSQEHYLSFLEQYNQELLNHIAGDPGDCFCLPDGWEWVYLPWVWNVPTHSGGQASPTFGYTNPANRQLSAIVAHTISDNPSKSQWGVRSSGLSDTWPTNTGGGFTVGHGYKMFGNEVLGVHEGRDAIGWPTADFKDIPTSAVRENPGATWTLEFHHQVDLGHSASLLLNGVRLLYKVV